MGYLYLAIAIAAEVIGTAALKLSDGFTKLGPSVVVVLGYSVAFYFLAIALRFFSVGVAYAIWSGLGIVLLSILGVFYFKESLDAWAITGMTLILAGVLVLNLLSKSVSH